jgi:hypothetical protein
MYKLQKDFVNKEVVSVLRMEDKTSIPMHPDNTDYIAYLAWVAEGNTPTPADEPTQGV